MYALNKLNDQVLNLITHLAKISFAVRDILESPSEEAADRLAAQITSYDTASEEMLAVLQNLVSTAGADDSELEIEVTGDPEGGYEL